MQHQRPRRHRIDDTDAWSVNFPANHDDSDANFVDIGIAARPGVLHS